MRFKHTSGLSGSSHKTPTATFLASRRQLGGHCFLILGVWLRQITFTGQQGDHLLGSPSTPAVGLHGRFVRSLRSFPRAIQSAKCGSLPSSARVIGRVAPAMAIWIS